MTTQTRNFASFLDGWQELAKDNFAPEIYHYWIGISMVAAALERKCHIKLSQNSVLFPNLYIFLIGKPGNGKSTAADVGVEFLTSNTSVVPIPTQVTPAAMVDFMANRGKVAIPELKPPFNIQCGGFWYSSEASNSFEEIAGSIVPTFTDWYGCPTKWQKETKKDGVIDLDNVYLNILACTTQNYLAKLIPPDDIAGGFASRLLYVLYDGKTVRNYSLSHRKKINHALKERVAQDLRSIYQLRGEFSWTPEFETIYSTDAGAFHESLQNTESERMQGLLGRKTTNILKLSMVMCAAEGDSMLLEVRHWEKAKEAYAAVEASFKKIVHLAADSKLTAVNAPLLVTKLLANAGGYMLDRSLKNKLTLHGIPKEEIDSVIHGMITGGMIELTQIKNTHGNFYKLLMDPSEDL